MNVNINTVNFNEICEGCLSDNRRLTLITDQEINELYISILQPLNHINNILALCWECAAVLRRFLEYKKQTHQAHRTLLSYMLHQTLTLPTLSRLIIHRNKPTNITPRLRAIDITQLTNNTLETNTDRKIPLNTNETLHRNTLNTNKNNTNVNNTNENVIKKNTNESKEGLNTAEPVFIKVEDEGNFEFCDEREDNGSDEEHNNEGAVEDIKIEPPTQHKKLKIKSKSKKTRKRKESEFNESDDEPLQKMKEEDDKPKGSRKQKEKDGGKPKRGSREKPPGVVTGACVTKRLQQLGAAAEYVEMVVLTWDEVEAERQRALASEAYSRQLYRCERCAVGFNHRFKLDNHMAKHDPWSGGLECSVCSVRCPSQHALAAHRRRHRVRWRCRCCGVTASRAGVLVDHAARLHQAPAPIHTCPTCGHTAPSLSKLRNHLKSHSERQRCQLCGKTFRDKSTLNTHLFIHNGKKEHECVSCGKMFLFKKAMQLHALTHQTHAHLYCHQCDMSFKNQMSYYQHMKYNLKHVDPGQLKYACQLCDKKFIKASRLHEHNTAIHLKETPIRCTAPDCTFACASRAVLRAHTRSRHRPPRLTRNHVCHHCGKTYTNKKTLEGHLRSHTGERPFACDKCGAQFRHHAALYNHARVHKQSGDCPRETTAGAQWTLPTEQTS